MAINSEFLRKNKFLKKYICGFSLISARKSIENIKEYLKAGDKILDIGSGTCYVCDMLNKKNYHVVPLDIKNLSLVDEIKPIIYDGKKLPFKDNEFDVALLLFVLHHTPNPEKILNEAKRVSKRIIIAEDIYESRFRKYLTYAIDCSLNQEFRNHPHSNKSDRQWKELFEKLKLKLIGYKYKKWKKIVKHAIYYLEK